MRQKDRSRVLDSKTVLINYSKYFINYFNK